MFLWGKDLHFVYLFMYNYFWPFKRQAHQVVKNTQTIRRLLSTKCLGVFDHLMGLALKGLN